MRRTTIRMGGLVAWLGVALLLSPACREAEDTQSAGPSASSPLPASLFLDAVPEGITSVASLKASAQEGDAVVIKAVVGGRKQTFVNNRAVMTVIDATVDNPCTGEDDHCPTPWDYCCTPPEQLLPNLASVQILGPDARALTTDLNSVADLKPLSVLVIQGIVGPRPDNATLTINATGIFVASRPG